MDAEEPKTYRLTPNEIGDCQRVFNLVPTPEQFDDQLVVRLLRSGWKKEYVDLVLQHMHALRVDVLKVLDGEELYQKFPSDGYLLTSRSHDNLSLPFGRLRGKGSVVECFLRYLRTVEDGEDILSVVKAYSLGVKESSWTDFMILLKWTLLQQQMAVTPDQILWATRQAGGPKKVEWSQIEALLPGICSKECEKFGVSSFDPAMTAKLSGKIAKGMAAWQALVIEVLRNTPFPGNDRAKCCVTVIRTEAPIAVESFELVGGPPSGGKEVPWPGKDRRTPLYYDVDLKGLRGCVESGSMYTVKNIHGSIVTEQDVPYECILGLYMLGQPGSIETTMSFFENDTENELNFIPIGIPFRIVENPRFVAKSNPADDFFSALRGGPRASRFDEDNGVGPSTSSSDDSSDEPPLG